MSARTSRTRARRPAADALHRERSLRAIATMALLAVCGLLPCAYANEPSLTVVVGGNGASYAPAALLALPGAATVDVPADPSYHRAMSYRAVPMAALLRGVRSDESVRVVARDGFAATMPASQLLATGDGAVAWLAIEPDDAPWPALKAPDPASAGPFYIVWVHPERGAIVPEQWVYQIQRIDVVAPLAKRFPAMAPAATLSAHDPARRGFDVFVRNCSVCHTVNLAGDSSVGPDLNVPYNPTEYLRPDALRRLIRDPQSLRRWPQARMPAFPTRVISDRELTDLLAYLRHMADRRVTATAK